MYPVSDAFKTAVRKSHKTLTKAEVLSSGNLIATVYPDLGSVDIDSRRGQRRSCSITINAGEGIVTETAIYNTYASIAAAYATYTAFAASASSYAATQIITGYETVQAAADPLVPASSQDVLTPYGNELKLYRGISYQQQGAFTYATLSAAYVTYSALNSGVANYGTLSATQAPTVTVNEYVPLGVFPMTKVSVNTTATGVQLQVDGVDRSLKIARNRWIDPYKIDSDTNVGTALLALLQDRMTDILTRFSATDATTPAVVLGLDSSNDPWSDAQRIADAAGLLLYFDADGTCVLEPTPDYQNASPFEVYQSGTEAMLLGANRELSSDGIYNMVVVTSENSETEDTFRSVAIDDDPASPTYVFGPFGQSPMFASSPLIKSQSGADRFAATRLRKIKGTYENIGWSQITDPSLDAGDLVQVINTVSRLAHTLVIDRLTIPMNVDGTMSAIARTISYSTED